MTPEQKRVKIAEACGWRATKPNASWPNPYWLRPSDNALCTVVQLPDYFTDLNAMHEAEGILDYRQLMEYDNQVEAKCYRDGDDTSRISCVRATAAQRAEAFGLTLKLW